MKQKSTILIALALLFLVHSVSAQSWRKLRKEADSALSNGDYATAAEKYEGAWKKKTKKTELIFQAGEAYYTIRDYRKAAESFQYVKDQGEAYPLAGLKYARSLKQDGQYDKAKAAFTAFLDSYTGTGRAILEDVIQREVQGCDLAKRLPASADKNSDVLYPGIAINTDSDEWAPCAITDDYIYFTSDRGGRARVFAAQRNGGDWSSASAPANFPVITNGHFGQTSISPDGQRMYFTICNGDDDWKGINTRCEIFVTNKQGASWSTPSRLPDYINTKGVTATHPFVTQEAGTEIIYYASNREGGRGGMDIWMTSRELDSNEFTFPVNLGPSVNTLGDEISPYYDALSETLFFSSNGQVTIGGYDIFKTKGKGTNWSSPVNAGLPYNSAADDYYYVLSSTGRSAWLSSNRPFGGEKTNTRDDDLFEIAIGGQKLILKGNVYNKEGNLLEGIHVQLFQIYEDDTEDVLVEKDFSGGSYLFELLPNRAFKVLVSRVGYDPQSYIVNTNEPGVYTFGEAVFLEPTMKESEPFDPGALTGESIESDSVDEVDSTDAGDSLDPEMIGGETIYTAKGMSEGDQLEYTTSAQRFSGEYYRVQVCAVKVYNVDKAYFQPLKEIGQIDTEYLTEEGLTRVLVGTFFSEQEAKDALQSVRSQVERKAYIVKYIDGKRYGRVNLK